MSIDEAYERAIAGGWKPKVRHLRKSSLMPGEWVPTDGIFVDPKFWEAFALQIAAPLTIPHRDFWWARPGERLMLNLAHHLCRGGTVTSYFADL